MDEKMVSSFLNLEMDGHFSMTGENRKDKKKNYENGRICLING